MGNIENNPVDSLVQNILIEEKAGESLYQYENYTMKWTLANELDLVFVACYLNITQMLYLEDLLEAVKKEFCHSFKKQVRAFAPTAEFAQFDGKYEKLLTKFESRSFIKPSAPRTNAKEKPTGKTNKAAGKSGDCEEGSTEGSSNTSDTAVDYAANIARLKNRSGKPGPSRRKGGKDTAAQDDPSPPKPKGKKQARKWGNTDLTQEDINECDFGDEEHDEDDGSLTREQFGAAPTDDDYMDESSSDEEEEGSTGGIFGFFQKIAGNKVLQEEDVKDVITEFRESLMSKNVAADIADKLCQSVVTNLVGKKLASFTTIKSTVKQCIEEALTKILTPKKSTDILQGIMKAKEQKKLYVVVFVGVNGVGKSTSLAKVAAYFMSKGLKVGIAACDTFRSGAIEQLRTHAKALGVTVYARGYNKDAASVAQFAIQQAQSEGQDVMLVDTAGRMQDNHPLMVSLAKLITVNSPDLILFVGEALVGNDAVDQLTKFNRCLKDLSDNSVNPRLIDGIVLTKYDTIDDKVGAAISMTYTTGQPIMFVGVGQTYKDLRRMNVKLLIKALLK